jgi:hypothetical protein
MKWKEQQQYRSLPRAMVNGSRVSPFACERPTVSTSRPSRAVPPCYADLRQALSGVLACSYAAHAQSI